MWQTIKRSFRNILLNEPLSVDFSVKVNACIGLLIMLSFILGIFIAHLQDARLSTNLWSTIRVPLLGMLFISGWLLRKTTKVNLDILLFTQGLILLIPLMYAPAQIIGLVDWWKNTSSNKGISISPGMMTLLSVYAARLISDFGCERPPRKLITFIAIFYGAFLDVFKIVQYVRIQKL